MRMRAKVCFLALSLVFLFLTSPAKASWKEKPFGHELLHYFKFENTDENECLAEIQVCSEPLRQYISIIVTARDSCDVNYLIKFVGSHTSLPKLDLQFNQLYIGIPLTQAHEGFAILKGLATSGIVDSYALKALTESFRDQVNFVANLSADPDLLREHYQNIRNQVVR